MSTSQDTRKVFQKPNILRKKPRAKRGAKKHAQSPEEHSLYPIPIKDHRPFDPAKINARVVTTEYPLLDQGSLFAAGSACESGRLFMPKENALDTRSEKVQNVAAASEVSKSEEVEATLTNISSLSKDQHTFFTHELYMVKPLFEQQDNCKIYIMLTDCIPDTHFYIIFLKFAQILFYSFADNEEEQNSLNIESFLVASPNKQVLICIFL